MIRDRCGSGPSRIGRESPHEARRDASERAVLLRHDHGRPPLRGEHPVELGAVAGPEDDQRRIGRPGRERDPAAQVGGHANRAAEALAKGELGTMFNQGAHAIVRAAPLALPGLPGVDTVSNFVASKFLPDLKKPSGMN